MSIKVLKISLELNRIVKKYVEFITILSQGVKNKFWMDGNVVIFDRGCTVINKTPVRFNANKLLFLRLIPVDLIHMLRLSG